ncbi:hypothetical protein BSR29_05350 [Boudabousia liubingyangii]|uniref:Uncharacterized protein n=1 Tax=Boudabousia liubingyangii TaxID=1921764 RepID=A0A1Q5PLI0_9ACTO|nr:hypothetical protein [Boudabousia liubingyangii]OKL47911.1 hypothetical protein BSR29_05350 [Boudabousia liubingyangii]
MNTEVPDVKIYFLIIVVSLAIILPLKLIETGLKNKIATLILAIDGAYNIKDHRPDLNLDQATLLAMLREQLKKYRTLFAAFLGALIFLPRQLPTVA